MKFFINYKYYGENTFKFQIPESLYTALAVMQPRSEATKSVHRVMNGLPSSVAGNGIYLDEKDTWELVMEY